MILRETAKLAVVSLGGHRLRSFLTAAGVAIGVFSVIGVMTIVTALRSSIETNLSFLGANTFMIDKNPVGIQAGGNNREKYRKRRNITYAEARRYAELMDGWASAVGVTAWSDDDVRASYGGRRTNPNLEYGGGDGNFSSLDQYAIDQGRNLTAEDVAVARPVALIGDAIRKKLFPAESPLGKVVLVDGHSYTVVGTFAYRGTSFGQSQDEIVVVPVTRFLNDNGPLRFSLEVTTQAPSRDLFGQTEDQAVTAMRVARRLLPGEDDDFEIASNDSLIAAFARVADTVSDGALVISAIALVAAGVGIMNIMLVSVTERTREIGVCKSIGARKRDILAQFLAEAVALSLAGGAAGIALGVAAGDGIALKLSAAAVVPWGWAAAGLLVCSAVGIGFGLYPALRAAALDPIEALRYE